MRKLGYRHQKRTDFKLDVLLGCNKRNNCLQLLYANLFKMKYNKFLREVSARAMFQKTAILSRGIWKIPQLQVFLPESQEVEFSWTGLSKTFDSVIGWGKKPTALKARKLAKDADLAYIAFEDGFLRSLGLGVDGAGPLGIIVDPVGVYYDASAPSKLENLLNDTSWFDAKTQEEATQGLGVLLANKLSKYNCFESVAFQASVAPENSQEYVLVVDQTQGDASVLFGSANAASFDKMLRAALDENPNTQIRIRQHPDVIAGKRKAYLNPSHFEDWPEASRISVSCDNANPWDDILHAQKVYVVTSQLGMEAVFADKLVRCFGLPCYAGWGLTVDELSTERRNNQITKEQLFAAAYLKYTRYVDPVTEQLTDFETIANLICDQKRHFQKLPAHIHYHGFSLWKKAFLKDFSGYGKCSTFSYSWQKPDSKLAEKSILCEWASGKDIAQNKQDQTHEIYLEDGFLRSVGLGSDLARPCSLVYDVSGIYYDARQSSDIEALLLNHEAHISEYDKQRAAKVISMIIDNALSKYNLCGLNDIPSIPDGKSVILVTGQVEGDASLRYGKAKFDSNEALLQHIRDENPDKFIIYKPHPDVVSGNRKGQIRESVKITACDWYAKDVSLPKVIELCDELHTATSLTGFEALLRGKVVFTYGMPFYAGWGLTQDSVKCLRRNKTVDLPTLVSAALIHYPVYVDPVTGTVCSVEHIIDWLIRNRTSVHKSPLKTQVIRAIKQVVNS